MTERAETAGSLLRAAREKQGLHIAALAAAIKVAPRKLDALENDRWNESHNGKGVEDIVERQHCPTNRPGESEQHHHEQGQDGTDDESQPGLRSGGHHR